MRHKYWLGIAAALLLGPGVSHAQAYPTKPVRMVVPFSPGGTSDIIARVVAVELGRDLGQQIIVDNRAGAGSTLGTDVVAKSAPDGYTLILNNSGLAYNATLYPKLPYDTVKDLAPVSLVGNVPNLFAVHPSMPVRSVKDFIAFARARPGQLAYASGGIGSSSHLATELLQIMTGLSFVHVPYKGAGPALIDLVSGQTQFMINSMPAVLPYVRSKRLLPLAVSSGERSTAAPELPTIAEGGVKGYEYVTWYGVLAPAGTPVPIIVRLNAAIQKAVASGAARNRLAEQGVDVKTGTPAEFGAIVRNDVLKWGTIIRKAKIKVE